MKKGSPWEFVTAPSTELPQDVKRPMVRTDPTMEAANPWVALGKLPKELKWKFKSGETMTLKDMIDAQDSLNPNEVKAIPREDMDKLLKQELLRQERERINEETPQGVFKPRTNW